MPNSYFQFKQFTIHQDRCAMKVTTDACLFGAWVAGKVGSQESGAGRILDIGTGTGLLSLMLAQKTNAHIDAIEIDNSTAEQASENITASPWKERINIIHGDVKKLPGIPLDEYDIIVSNPPFYENELTSPDAKKNIAHHDEGLLLPELLEVTRAVLAPGGRLYLLLPYKRMTEAGLLLQKHLFSVTHTALVRQSAQHGYLRVFIEAEHSGNSNINYPKDEIIIKNEKNEYTKEFTELLKDYYLYL
ncbi:MAG TPA: methyltransferase [Chitinophagaceae bacterium]